MDVRYVEGAIGCERRVGGKRFVLTTRQWQLGRSPGLTAVECCMQLRPKVGGVDPMDKNEIVRVGGVAHNSRGVIRVNDSGGVVGHKSVWCDLDVPARGEEQEGAYPARCSEQACSEDE